MESNELEALILANIKSAKTIKEKNKFRELLRINKSMANLSFEERVDVAFGVAQYLKANDEKMFPNLFKKELYSNKSDYKKHMERYSRSYIKKQMQAQLDK